MWSSKKTIHGIGKSTVFHIKQIVVNEEIDGGEINEEQNNAKVHPETQHDEALAEDTSHNLRDSRTKRKLAWMMDYEVNYNEYGADNVNYALCVDTDPIILEEAMKGSKWRKALDNEIKSIESYKTWELTELTDGQKSIGFKWIFKTKLNEKGEVNKYKARLVTKEYKRKYWVDYKEVFAPIASQDTIRLVISLGAQNSCPIYQLHVKSAF